MFLIDDVLISRQLQDEMFACDLAKCKGACCVEGELGAPVEEEERSILDEIYPKVKPYMNKAGKKAVAEQGTSLLDITNSYSTPLVNDKECAYVYFEKGIALCAIEKAYFDGKISFRKPVSCHLYPIRITKTSKMEAINYDRWDICNPACKKGKQEGIRVYEFLKEAIIRKYGEDFYEELDAIIQHELAQQKSS